MIMMEKLRLRRDLILAGAEASGHAQAGPKLCHGRLHAQVTIWPIVLYHTGENDLDGKESSCVWCECTNRVKKCVSVEPP